ncbi:MAG: 2OG-Fe(II) oxygenase [Alphaproteobacteria bacterium]|jgi:SM-20-related protein|nr:2OG-Fe(II) oxygenase [Alphaproteobacteria bacterium]
MTISTNGLNLDVFTDTPLVTDPYEHLVVPGFLDQGMIDGATADFPNVAKAGLFPTTEVSCTGGFQKLLDALDGPEFEAAIAEKFSVEVSGLPKLFTVRGRAQPKDGRIHTDSVTKVITVLVYLNRDWSGLGGRLRVLRGPDDIADYTAEIEPAAGTLFAFLRSDKSFHGHEPFDGERRAIQMNWMTTVAVRDREISRHRFSSRLKRLLPIG